MSTECNRATFAEHWKDSHKDGFPRQDIMEPGSEAFPRGITGKSDCSKGHPISFPVHMILLARTSWSLDQRLFPGALQGKVIVQRTSH
ncbi:hypothetical protein WMY93_021712 [Mugilogobius chulae]|uniref:Uncharacterized protein n=1 Tax=Mugilogobius chulae TaxID=88201 RepID=A0AAW0NLY3_9GOBI